MSNKLVQGDAQFVQSASAKNTEKKYQYQVMNATLFRADKEPMTEAEWDTVTQKIISICNSHGLAFHGSTKPMGLVEDPKDKKESSIIIT